MAAGVYRRQVDVLIDSHTQGDPSTAYCLTGGCGKKEKRKGANRSTTAHSLSTTDSRSIRNTPLEKCKSFVKMLEVTAARLLLLVQGQAWCVGNAIPLLGFVPTCQCWRLMMVRDHGMMVVGDKGHGWIASSTLLAQSDAQALPPSSLLRLSWVSIR